MNSAYFHLTFAHISIVGFGFALLLNIYSLFNKSIEVKKMCLWFYVIVGVMGTLAYFTGDGAEEIIKSYPGASGAIIDIHENMALFFFIGLMVIAVLALLGLYFSIKGDSKLFKITIVTLIISALLCVLAIKTASTGGNIRHTEINQGIIKNKQN